MDGGAILTHELKINNNNNLCNWISTNHMEHTNVSFFTSHFGDGKLVTLNEMCPFISRGECSQNSESPSNSPSFASTCTVYTRLLKVVDHIYRFRLQCLHKHQWVFRNDEQL